MTRRRAIWMGVCAFLPLLFIPVVFGGVLLLGVTGKFQPRTNEFPLWILPVFAVQCLVAASSVTAIVLEIFDIFRNPRLQEKERPLWVILLVFFGLIASPLYWVLHVRPYLRAPTA